VHQAWLIVTESDEVGGVRRDEASLSYVRQPQYANHNIRSESWSVFPKSFVSAPADRFEALKPQLYAVGAARRPTAKWFVQSQALLAELSRQRIESRGTCDSPARAGIRPSV
jgi:hypothetical protein